MNRVPRIVFCVMIAAICLLFGVSRLLAQAQKPPSPPPAAAEGQNPDAAEAAPVLPPGMTGSDVNDPRAKLAPGPYDAGEASMGMKHLKLVRKP
ncbi:MAG: hypothetical protein ACHP79_19715, partial [Terriglobales bacterium]